MLWSYHVDAGQVTVGLNWEKQRNCRIHTIGWFPPNGYMYKNMIPAQRGLLSASSKQKSYIWARKKNTSFVPLYWLLNRDPYNGL